MPFVAGTVSIGFYFTHILAKGFVATTLLSVFLCQSTSLSHSVNANVQSVLHLLKTRQPRVCERMPPVPGSEPKKRGGSYRAPPSPGDGAAALGSLSELLLALQDELGHMSLWVTGACLYEIRLTSQHDPCYVCVCL